MSPRVAACSCGGLTARCEGAPERISVCHCLECQRRTGSVFGVQARYRADRVRCEGEHATWTRTGDAGARATFRFCPTCAATVWWTLDVFADAVILPVGAFADPDFGAPTFSVYEARCHAWARPAHDLERMD